MTNMAKILVTPTGDQALTFDDVLLQPSHSEVLPGQTNIATTIAEGIDLSLPIMSAAMDTVTESKLAIAMAQAAHVIPLTGKVYETCSSLIVRWLAFYRILPWLDLENQ